MTPNKIKFNKSLWPYFLVNLDKLYIKICPNISSFWEEKKNNKNNLFRHFSLRGVFYSEDPQELLLVSFFFNINYMNFYATFFIRSKSKENLKKKDFRKIKGVRGNSEVSTIDKSVFAPFFLFINFFWFFLSQNV